VRPFAPILLLAAALLAVGAAATGATPNPANQARLDSTVRYLQEAQNRDGGFGGEAGGDSAQGISAWVALALAAAGINPRCQARPGRADVQSFLAGHFQRGLEEEISWPRVPSTALERELMVVNASGADPHAFAGHDLVAELLARELPGGSFPYVPGGRGEINDTAFAILALAPVGEPAAAAAAQRAAGWLISQQDEDGGWSWGVRGDPTEADLTGAAIQALRAAGRADTDAERDALAYLRAMQRSDGGFPEHPGEAESNVASTAWAVQGAWAAGQDPETWLVGASEPLSYLASLQQPDGHLRWKASMDLNGVWMTAYAAPAFAGQTWPIPSPPCVSPPSTPAQPGEGEGSQSGRGTIAGGGSAGAPLFSRPRQGSRGRTPGGARLVGRHPSSIAHGDGRRGERRQPSGTETEEASSVEREPRLVAAGASGPRRGGGEDGSAAGLASTPPVSTDRRDRAHGAAAPRTVTGMLIGSEAAAQSNELAFGAPGLHSAGTAPGSPWLAAAIGAAALLCGVVGSQLERRRRAVG
jgi:hypothetical protein